MTSPTHEPVFTSHEPVFSEPGSENPEPESEPEPEPEGKYKTSMHFVILLKQGEKYWIFWISPEVSPKIINQMKSKITVIAGFSFPIQK